MAEIIEANNNESATLSVAQRLAQARVAQHLSIEQVARYLRLSESVVRALESDTPATEIPATYFRGYLRAYAKLLNIEIETPVTKATAAVSNADNTIIGIQNLQSLPQQSTKSRSVSLKSVMMSLLFLCIVGGGFFWWRSGFVLPALSQKAETVSSAKPVAETTDAVRGEVALNLPTDNTQTAVVDTAPVTETTATELANITLPAESKKEADVKNAAKENDSKPLAITTTAVDVSRGGETLEFVFVEDCWVRVTDAQGDVLAVGIKRTGQRFVVAGPAPLKIDLGNPTGVQLKHNNRAVDLTPYPGGRPARLTIEATKFE